MSIEEDPSVFDYDGVYDEMKGKIAHPKVQDRMERMVLHFCLRLDENMILLITLMIARNYVSVLCETPLCPSFMVISNNQIERSDLLDETMAVIIGLQEDFSEEENQ